MRLSPCKWGVVTDVFLSSSQLYETANKYHFYHSLALLGAAHSSKPAVVSVRFFLTVSLPKHRNAIYI